MKAKTPEEKIMNAIFGERGIEASRRVRAKKEAEERKLKFEETVPLHVRKIMARASEECKAAMEIINTITPDGTVLMPKKDWLDKKTPQYSDVYNVGEMIGMFNKGVEFGEKRVLDATAPKESMDDKSIEDFIATSSLNAIGDVPGNFVDRIHEWGKEIAKRYYELGKNAK